MTPIEFVPATQAELARYMSENFGDLKKKICPVGGRTALHYGMVGRPDVLASLSELKRVIDYPARDMTITVEAGMRIDSLKSQLALEGQRLPIDIAQPGRATLGGAIATNTSGPRRFGHGTFRDYVIGISAVDAAGRLFKAGGRVVKNVAGYDLCKLLVGSRGTVGIVTQVTLKLRPIPEKSALVCFGLPGFEQAEQALQVLLKSEARPIAIEVLNGPAARLISAAARSPFPNSAVTLVIGVEGSAREVDWQLETLKRELASCSATSGQRIDETDAIRLWDALTEFPTCADDPLTFQASLLPSRAMEFANRATQLGVAVQVHAGNGIVVGQLPEEAATAERNAAIINELRQIARSAKGNLVVLHCDPEWFTKIPLCGDPEPSWGLMERLKQQFDPHGLLNPGWFSKS